MEATEPKQRTHCSVCGQKVVRQDMPYCIYCGNHFALMEAPAGAKRRETKNMARLAKMPEHADFPAGMAAHPGEGGEFEGWRRRTRGGIALAVAGIALLALRFVAGFGGAPFLVLGSLAVLAGGLIALRFLAKQRARLELPLMKRAAVVTDRRSETEMRFTAGITTYFFTFEFEDGNEAEFRSPGRGAHTEPLSKGVTGIAYTRGAELVEFLPIRV